MEFNKCKAGGTMSVNKYNFVLNHLTPTPPPPLNGEELDTNFYKVNSLLNSPFDRKCKRYSPI